MFLSSVELLGFKSFANKTSIAFEPGITSIVGPNGCGKTNIVDAIRWVLGEQRTSNLRTEKMGDVIFNGTNGRKPLGMAQVSLTLHNTKGVLPTEYTDVVITRRLYRSGESEYLLNKNVVRLKDITDLFMDTGMGSDAYSVIELKMIDSLLSDDANERRRLFEEAAGITKYKFQRRSTYRKLDATKTDLLRIHDIISEVEKNVRSLKYQLGKFKRYEKEKEKLRNIEIRLARFQYHDILKRLSPIESRLGKEKAKKDSTASQIEMDEALHEKLDKDLRGIEDQLGEVDADISANAEKLHNARESLVVAQQNERAEKAAIERSGKLIADAEERMKTLIAQEADADKIAAQAEADLIVNKKKLEAASSNLDSADELNRKMQSELRDFEASKTDIYYKLNDVNASKEKISSLIEHLRLSTDERSNDEETIVRELEKLSKDIRNRQRRKKALITERKANDEQLAKIDEILIGLKKEIEELTNKRSKIYAEHELLKSRIALLEELIESRGGLSSGVANLMKKADNLKGILGTVSDLINVSTDYRLPIEHVLGGASEYVVVDTLANARKAAEWTLEQKKGAVTFIALDRLNPPKVDPPKAKNRVPAVDVVKSDHELLVRTLLGDVVIIPSTDVPEEKPEGWRFVTDEGILYESAAIMKVGFPPTGDAGLVGRRELRDALAEKIRVLDKESNDIESKLTVASASLKSRSSEKDAGLAREREILQEDANLSGLIKAAQASVESSKKRLGEISDKTRRDENQTGKLNRELEQIITNIERLESERDEILSEQDSIIEKAENAVTEREEVAAAYQEAAIEVIAGERKLESLRFQQKGIAEARDESKTRIDASNKEIMESNEKIDKAIQVQSEAGKESERYEKHRHDLIESREKLLSAREEFRIQREEVDRELRERRRHKEQALESTQQLEIRLTELKMEGERIFNRMTSEYHTDISEPPKGPSINEAEEEQSIERLRKRIESLGAVNLAAEEDYQTESERLNFLIQQRDDLLNAEKSLVSTIRKIDEAAEKQFQEVFGTIRTNFHRTFAMFFDGGEADLRLKEDADPLDAAVMITARPPGKRNQALRLLSGGEKALTAISLLFAIYLVKPSPFCILDEVDAPLDDANIKRFNRVLEEFAKDTQFIVVTHNKDTMKASGALYGVTMQELGVSKIVSVKLN